jgi:exonuclease III
LIPHIISYLHAVIFVFLVSIPLVADAQIILDGNFSDWKNIATVAESDSFVRKIKLTDDEKYLYGYLQLADSISIQSFNGRLSLLFISSYDTLNLIFSRQDNLQTKTYVHTGFGAGIGYHKYDREILAPPNELSLAVLPSHQSKQFEFRIIKNRDEVFTDHTGIEVQAFFTLNDSTSNLESAGYTFKNYAFSEFSKSIHKDDNELRLLTWNVMGDKLKNYSVFRKIIDIANPDIVMLEEVYEDIQLDDLQKHLFPPGWHISMSENGYRKTVIATREPHKYLRSLSEIEYPSDNIRDLINKQPVGLQWMDENRSNGISSSGVLLKAGKREILFVLVGLTCCGHDGSWEDTMRILEASLLSERIQNLQLKQELPVVISGDFNLVGSIKPLEILRNTKYPPLKVLDMLQHSDRAAYTWRTLKKNPFAPGRLDYVLVDQSLDAEGLILKLEDLLTDKEVLKSSDHYPLITDIKKQ